MTHYVKVAIDLALDRLFTYSVPAGLTEKLRIGQLLRVPFGGRETRGFALALASDPGGIDPAKIKPVLGLVDEAPFFSQSLLELVRWISSYTLSPIETCLKTALPAAVLKPSARPKELLYVSAAEDAAGKPMTKRQGELLADIVRLGGGWLAPLCKELSVAPATLRSMAAKGLLEIKTRVSRRNPLAGRTIAPTVPLALNQAQSAALETISSADRPVLLHGVTGSGKTEVYLQAIARELDAGRGAIVLVPEIALTPQTVRRFAGRFGSKVAVLHSALSDGERYDEWHRIRKGEARVAVGPRSAVFAPVENLGLIVVDEEHDGSYKQDEAPRYNARDIAVVRGSIEGARVVLGSATPSLESWRNARLGKYVLAPLPERVEGRALPDVQIVDMEEEMQSAGHLPVYSRFLLDAIALRLRRGEQTMLFLNRRGYSRSLKCKNCGWTATCGKCTGHGDDVESPALPYTYHEADRCLRCHVCGEWRHAPDRCPQCGTRDFAFPGIGTQRAESVLRKCFPKARILRMDADSTARKMSHDDILSAFRAHQADILLGTQMIAKGLDFPNVTLVGVLNADTSLNMPDFRAAERTYQLLAQVSGRAGRADKPGEVFIQTFSPEHPAVKMAADGSTYGMFADLELEMRKDGRYPPYCRLATLVFRAKEDALASSWAALYARSLANYALKTVSPQGRWFAVSEAVPAALAKADGWYRHQIVMRAQAAKDIASAVRWIRAERPAPETVRIAFDMDALNLL